MRMGKIEELREQAQIAMGNMQALERAYDFADDDDTAAAVYAKFYLPQQVCQYIFQVFHFLYAIL